MFVVPLSPLVFHFYSILHCFPLVTYLLVGGLCLLSFLSSIYSCLVPVGWALAFFSFLYSWLLRIFVFSGLALAFLFSCLSKSKKKK